jgi:hypothetical protein
MIVNDIAFLLINLQRSKNSSVHLVFLLKKEFHQIHRIEFQQEGIRESLLCRIVNDGNFTLLRRIVVIIEDLISREVDCFYILTLHCVIAQGFKLPLVDEAKSS